MLSMAVDNEVAAIDNPIPFLPNKITPNKITLS